MAESPKESSEDKTQSSPSVDLSGLQGLSLGPNWGTEKGSSVSYPGDAQRPDRRGSDRGGDRGHGGSGGQRRDRRGPPRGTGARREDGPPGEQGGAAPGGGFGGARDGRRGPREDRRHERDDRRDRGRGREAPAVEHFEPIVDVAFYPEDNPFKALTNAIRTSLRTFELFEIARLILEKPERFVCVVEPRGAAKAAGKGFFISVPDGLPFDTEEACLSHVFKNYLERFFDVEDVEVDPPSGSFQVVNKCGFTGEILGPPNYHRYQALCQEHYAARLAHMPYERFAGRIETVRDEEMVAKWLEKMRHQKVYRLRDQKDDAGEPVSFTDPESARIYMITRCREQIVRTGHSARFSGHSLHLLPSGNLIRRSIDVLVAQQQRFPLDTANHLRGRLRRMGFAVYKKGSKGISYVCAVKRRFRQPGERLAENLDELISFIEAHKDIHLRDLPVQYLGIRMPNAAAPHKAQAPEVAEEAPETAPADAPAAPAEENPAAAEGATPEPAHEHAHGETAHLTAEERERFMQLKRDLKYLITQGYVIEYSDGRLYVPPPHEASPEDDHHEGEPKRQKKAKKFKGDAKPKVEAGAEAAPAALAASEPAAEPEATLVEEPAGEAVEPPVAEPAAEPVPEPTSASEPEAEPEKPQE